MLRKRLQKFSGFFILSLAPSFFLVVPSILFRHVLSRTRIFSRSFYSSIFYFCSALFISACLFCFVLVVIYVFFCFARTLVACFSLGARLFCFVIVVVSAFCSMQCGLVPHHLSLIRSSVFCTVIFSFFTYYRHADFSQFPLSRFLAHLARFANEFAL